ncbi:uncharacterized protein LOC143880305 [Tasmannia lanceolata]|uniref:uncharacterized protein LOC143880305 n=1 Tax=Tasmannia lanceolata TaxID=3420 RepID=UPI0040640667
MNRISRETVNGGRSTPAGTQHRRGRSLTGISAERDENLDLFSRNRRILPVAVPSVESDASMKLGRLSVKLSRSGLDDPFSSGDGGKHDYDWLLTPPGTPPFSSTHATESQPSPTAPRSTSSVRSVSTTKASRFSTTQSENNYSPRPARSSSVTRPSISNTHYTHSSNCNKTSILNTSTASITSYRPSTPVTRSPLPSSARSSTPTTRPNSVRSSTPAKTRPAATSSGDRIRPSPNPRPSTPTARPQTPANLNSPSARSNSRPSTPTRRNPIPASTPIPGRSSSVGRAPPRKPTVASRPSSPGPRARRPQQPIVLTDIPVPPNLRTTLQDRPLSAGRTRPGSSLTVRANSEPTGPVNPPRRQSSSQVVTRGRLPEPSGKARLHSNGHEVRPPEIQKPIVPESIGRRAAKPVTSTESTGFGRTISKKSLDMALRHMDIRNGMGSIRTMAANSLYPQSIRSATQKGRPARVSDTPSSVGSNGTISENGYNIDRYSNCETNHEDRKLSTKLSEPDRYESSRYDAILLKEDSKNMDWLHSLDNQSDQSPVFDHRFDPLPEPFDLI